MGGIAPPAARQRLAALEATAPTADEKDALAGTDGSPEAANPFVTDTDPRLDEGATLEADLASTALGEGASKVGVHDAGGILTATTVEGALAEIQTRVTTWIADLASTALNKGASLIGIHDAGGIITAATVEGALAEIQTRVTTLISDLASTAVSKGASLIGVYDTAANIVATTVEAALAEIFARQGPWNDHDFAGSGTVALTLPTDRGKNIRVQMGLRSSQAVPDGTAPVTINSETSATSYQLQNSLGTNNAANANEANSNVLVSYTGSTAPSGELAYNEIVLVDFRTSLVKKMLNIAIAYARSATDLVMGQRQVTRVAATSGAVGDTIQTWGFILPAAATPHADSWLRWRWES